jgi:hypothetical protein
MSVEPEQEKFANRGYPAIAALDKPRHGAPPCLLSKSGATAIGTSQYKLHDRARCYGRKVIPALREAASPKCALVTRRDLDE